MEKSNNNQFNADDLSINSVYLNTFRKRKKNGSGKSNVNSQSKSSMEEKKKASSSSEHSAEAEYKTISNGEIGEIADSVDNITGVVRQSAPSKATDSKSETKAVYQNGMDESQAAEQVGAPVSSDNSERFAQSKPLAGDSLSNVKKNPDAIQKGTLESARISDDSIYRTIAITTMMACKQLIPVIYKSVAEMSEEKTSATAERTVEPPVPVPVTVKERSEFAEEIDWMKLLYNLKRQWKTL